MTNKSLHYCLKDMPDNSAKGLDYKTAETPFFAIKQRNQIYIYRNSCPHLGVPLEWMPDQFLDRDGHYIQCATHGALFRVDNGLCVSGPCKDASLQAVPFQLKQNSIIISTEYLPDHGTTRER